MEDALDGSPGFPDGQWGIVSVFHVVVDEFPGVWPRAASGLEDVWTSVKFVLPSSLGHMSWSGAGCDNE